jgi:hypothetical protein
MTASGADAVAGGEPVVADDAAPDAPAVDEHAWSRLDPMIRLGVGLAGVMFCGVMVLAFFLVPYALITNGWTPSP